MLYHIVLTLVFSRHGKFGAESGLADFDWLPAMLKFGQGHENFN
jgi:hypothetical protein